MDSARKGWETRRSSPNESPTLPPSKRPKKLKLWSDDNMRNVIEAVRSGEMKVAI